MSVIRFQVLLVVAHGTLMNQSILGSGEVGGAVSGREIEAKPAPLA